MTVALPRDEIAYLIHEFSIDDEDHTCIVGLFPEEVKTFRQLGELATTWQLRCVEREWRVYLYRGKINFSGGLAHRVRQGWIIATESPYELLRPVEGQEWITVWCDGDAFPRGYRGDDGLWEAAFIGHDVLNAVEQRELPDEVHDVNLQLLT